MLNNNIVFKFFFYQFNATREYQFIICWMRIFQYTFISLCYSLENKPLGRFSVLKLTIFSVLINFTRSTRTKYAEI